MKRHDQHVAGGAKVRELTPDVAGRRDSRGGIDVASFRHGLHDPASSVAEDAALIEEFIDFLAGDALDGGALPAPDPAFQERLRCRVWRQYVVAYLRKGNGTH